MIHSDEYLQSLIEEAEKVISERVPCIFNRFSLATTAGTAVYTLPNNVFRIIGISWKGEDLLPADWNDFQTSVDYVRPQNISARGLPKWYVRLYQGWNKIMFHPNPNESITALSGETGIDLTTNIQDKVIISCYRIADPSGVLHRLPNYMFRNVMKYYAMNKAYLKEGVGQNLQAAEYFNSKYELFISNYSKIINSIPNSVLKSMGNSSIGRSGRPARPTLPTTGKWSI